MSNSNLFGEINRCYPVSYETYERLEIYHDYLMKWQKKINLISNDTIHNIWQRHFIDSLQIAKHINQTDAAILDMGTGAGFPGMVLAICGFSNIHLMDNDNKKIIFLKEIARLTRTKTDIHNTNIGSEMLTPMNYIISRACSPLLSLLALASFYLTSDSICLFHKGKNYAIEIENAKALWHFDISVIPSVIDSQGVILRLANIRKII